MNYQEANVKLQGRCQNSRKLENNTYLERRDNGAIAVRFHRTDVLTYYKNSRVVIDFRGYNTITTKDRINEFLPYGFSVGSEQGQLFLYRYNNHTGCNPVQWFGGGSSLTVHSNGKVVGGLPVDKGKALIRENRNAAARPGNRLRYWLRKARGIYVDRSNCTAHRWDCGTRSGRNWRGGQGLTEGEYACGCRVYQKVASADKLTVAAIMAEENVSVRLAKMHIYGLDRFLVDAGSKVLNEHGEYQLISLDLDQWHSVKALRMTCPSTGVVYISPVHPNATTVAEALDWMFQTENYLGQVSQQT
jgi:hypothetical protein